MKDFLKKIKIKTKAHSPCGRINPHNHWRILLSLFLVIVVCLTIFSVYLLFQIKNQQIFQIIPVVQERNSLIDEKLSEKTEKIFEDKKLKEEEIIDKPYKYGDPS